MTKLSPRYIAFAGVLMSIFAMASALYLQHFGGLEPCPLCTFQRVGYVAAGVLFFLAALHNPARIGRVIYSSGMGNCGCRKAYLVAKLTSRPSTRMRARP